MKLSALQPIVTMTEPMPCRCRLDIEVPAEYVSQALAYSAQMFVRDMRVPGFRQGHAPKGMIERKFAADIVEEARRAIVHNAVEVACRDKDVKPETDPTLEGVASMKAIEIVKGQPVKFAIAFDVAPKFSLPDYKTVMVTRENVKVDDTAINEVVRNMLQNRISYETVTRPAQKGDLLKVSYVAELAEPIELSESAKYILESKSNWMPLTEPEFIPGTLTALIGAETGNLYHVEVTFPADYFEKSLAGRKANYKITVEEIQAVNMPELTDEVAKEFGVGSAEDMLKNIRGYLENQENYRADMSFREKVAQTVLAGVEFPLPPETLEDATRDEFRRLAEAEKRRARGDQQALVAKKDELMQAAHVNAIATLRRRYVFLAIAEAEGLKVDKEDVDAVIESLARATKISPKAMAKRISRNNRLNDLFINIRESKAIDFVATMIEQKIQPV